MALVLKNRVKETTTTTGTGTLTLVGASTGLGTYTSVENRLASNISIAIPSGSRWVVL